MKRFNTKQRIIMLVAIMVALTLAVVSTQTYLLYETSIEQQKARLLASVKSQARTLEAFNRNMKLVHDHVHSSEYVEDVLLRSVKQAHQQYEGFGNTGEFVLAQLVGDKIEFLLSHRHGELAEPSPIAIFSEMAEPMRRALSGNSGTIIALDYRGELVVAAYEYVSSLDIGVVSKIDLAEVREPFIETTSTGLIIAFVFIVASVWLFHFVIMPVNTQLESQAVKIEQINKRMRIAAESIEMGIWDWDIVQNKLIWDEWMFKLYDVDPDNFSGEVTTWLQSVHPDDLNGAKQLIESAVENKTNFHHEYRIIRPNGEIRHIKADAILVLNAQHEPLKMIGVNVDITEKVQLQEKLNRSGRLEAIGKLAGGIAHDFNNLLAIMMGRAEILKMQLPDDPGALKGIDHIIASIERGSSLAKRLLIFSRTENAYPKVFQPDYLLNNTEDMLRRSLGEIVALSIEIEDDVCNIKVDEHQFENAIINLAVNAFDAMPNGGNLTIKVSNEYLAKPINLYSQTIQAGLYVKFVISDTGVGIPASALDQIFEPFFSTKTEENGTGLGLSMVYGFVKQYGGFIDVETQVGEGTTFTLYFPASKESKQEKDREITENILPKVDGGNILVVEDNLDLLDITAKSLQMHGYRVITATDANEALDIIHSDTRIDLLFTDVVLPGNIKGTMIAEALCDVAPGTPVILTTGYAKELQLNPDFQVLPKPYSRSDLLYLIDECMAQIKVVS